VYALRQRWSGGRGEYVTLPPRPFRVYENRVDAIHSVTELRHERSAMWMWSIAC
jgi:hypothetical protein